MEKLIVGYSTALLAKEKGFNEMCPGNFGNTKVLQLSNWVNNDLVDFVAAPTHQQLIDWLRERHLMDVYINPQYRGSIKFSKRYELFINGIQLYNENQKPIVIDDYYIALNTIIDIALKRVN